MRGGHFSQKNIEYGSRIRACGTVTLDGAAGLATAFHVDL